ncbi:MAG: hypothetical protein QXM53_08190 [Thermofilaceae archaeon]
MPEPVVVHIIATTALLGAVLLIVASVAIAQYITYVQTLNTMLAEAAENCAKQIVELVSVHTLGGEELTYMLLTLPQSLGGQPYNLTLENIGENVIAVRAQLQLHRQVRIVVTPNFGQAPVYAVREATRFGDLVLLPTILLPTPYGWEAALVAVRSNDALLIGFTTQPPNVHYAVSPPRFLIVNWTTRLEGLIGSEKTFSFVIFNSGSKGKATVTIDDGEKPLIEPIVMMVGGRAAAQGTVKLALPLTRGSYTWFIRVKHDDVLHDARSFTVVSLAPQIVIKRYDASISTPLGSPLRVSLTIENTGDYDGTAVIKLNSSQIDKVPLQPQQSLDLVYEDKPPNQLGKHVWVLAVETLETGYVEERQITVNVVDPDSPYISWVNGTIEGLVNWNARIHVCVSNPGSANREVQLLLNGSRVGSLEIPAGEEVCTSFTKSLPSEKGIYWWSLSLASLDANFDERTIKLIVKDLTGSPVRGAIFYDTFSSPSSDWIAIGGTLRITGGKLDCEDRDKAFCGPIEKSSQTKCATVCCWNRSLSGYNRISAVVQIQVKGGDKNVENGVAFATCQFNHLYGVTLFMGKRRGSGVPAVLRVTRYDGSWSLIDWTSEFNLAPNVYYTLFVDISLSGGYWVLTYQIYDENGNPISNTMVKTLDQNWKDWPCRFGLFVDDDKNGIFDNVVLAINDPRYIVVKGLPPRWRVELYSGKRLIASGLSDGAMDVKLSVVTVPIVESARIVVKDPGGALYREYSFGVLVGGDTLVFSP